ncbi:hypothetical protein F5148DRAFT_1288329 [Russula earlei]|uniref:Uncharacterized protein n=1 Tax=Russula earlei TaxID=71964 RepID=A0ACC0U1J6_9AGAM|nr:hypothetical protein F5148DRAFT_1288329 [Russula earlei]
MSEMLDVWPVLPLVISQPHTLWEVCWRNVAVALESEHYHRICKIDLAVIERSDWERLAAAMQKPFPDLTSLRFLLATNTGTPLPHSFLGGSATLLRQLMMGRFLFLWDIPNSGYISPQDLGTALSVLSRLETLGLGFQSPLYPASVHEYLEDLLAQIEVPLLSRLVITFFMDIVFVLPQLHRLISQFTEAQISFRRSHWKSAAESWIGSSHRWPRSAAHSFPFLSTLVHLDIADWDIPQSHWKDDMETTQWLELLAPFTAMKDLRLTHQVAPHVCQALEELAGERVTEVLPALQNIFLKGLEPLGSVPKYIEGFVAARSLSGHPVAVHSWL